MFAILAAILIAAEAAGASASLTPSEEIANAKDAAVDGLTELEQKVAWGLAGEMDVPKLDTSNPNEMVKGAWGYLRDEVMTVTQVLDDDSYLCVRRQLMVNGIPTADIADDDLVNVSGIVFRVEGTETYTTAIGGTNTVRVLSVANTGPAGKAANKLRDLAKYRVWTDSSGKFTVAAEFMQYKSSIVTLSRLRDGKILRLPMKRLSADDQKYVRELVKAMRRDSGDDSQ